MNFQKKNGWTVVELIIAITVTVTLLVIISGSLKSFRDSKILDNALEKIVSSINQARFKTIFSENSLSYGVHFDEDKVTLFEGTVFDAFSTTNEIFFLDQKVKISQTSLNGGGDEILFKRLTGNTDENGTIDVVLKKDELDISIIKVEPTGIVEIE